MPMSSTFKHDVLVIGSGAAGLSLALRLPPRYRVALLSKADLTQGSTYWAQGGMAAVLHDRDTIDSHVADTLAAGAGRALVEARPLEATCRRAGAHERAVVGAGAGDDRGFYCLPEVNDEVLVAFEHGELRTSRRAMVQRLCAVRAPHGALD